MENSGGLELEVFAADVCNIWLDDVSEPRCLKYWQSFRANNNGNPLKLVNNRKKNYPTGLNPEAMYVSQDVFHNNNLDLNDLRLYYGGILTGNPIPGLIPMIHTAYGDFNGDCVIDNDDRFIFNNAVTAPGVTTPNPNADWDGDCDVDLADAVEFSARLGANPGPPALCEMGTQPACNCPSFFDVCPSGGASGGGGPEGMSALMAVAFVDFVSMEELEDESDWPEFVGVIGAATDWCLVHMTPGQRQGICNALSNPALPLAMPEAGGLIPEIIATLCG